MSVFQRIKQRCMQSHPEVFNRPVDELIAEVKQRQREGEIETSQRVYEDFKRNRMKSTVGRSGLQERHMGCTLANYAIENQGQAYALEGTKFYADNFDRASGFVFHGNPGTGKNHLAAGICNELFEQGHTVLVITVSEIMAMISESYSTRETSEKSILESLTQVDLLVLDEVGRTVGNRIERERVVLDEIFDRRSKAMKATGVLTNLDLKQLAQCIGYRALERMMEDDPVVREFNWDSYRMRQTA